MALHLPADLFAVQHLCDAQESAGEDLGVALKVVDEHVHVLCQNLKVAPPACETRQDNRRVHLIFKINYFIF